MSAQTRSADRQSVSGFSSLKLRQTINDVQAEDETRETLRWTEPQEEKMQMYKILF